MVIYLSGKVEVFPDLRLLAVFLYLYNGRSNIAIVCLIDFQGFLLQSFGGIRPISHWRLFYTEDIPCIATTNPYLTEVGTSFFVL